MNLIEELKFVVENHLLQNPFVSINGLAAKSNVPATTLRRIVNLSVKGNPSPHTVLNLVSEIYKEKNLKNLIEKTEGEIRSYLESAFGIYIENITNHKYHNDLNEILEDRINYFIYKLAANKSGTTEMEILELFGVLGKGNLENLLKIGLVIKKGNKLHARDKNFSLDIAVAHKHLSMLVKFYKPVQIPLGRNIFYSLSESLNEEGIQKIKNIHKEAIKKIFEIINCPFYEGNIPYFSLTLADTITLQPTNEVLQ